MTQHGVQGGNISLLPFRLKENNYISLKHEFNCITILMILGIDRDSTVICNLVLGDQFYYIKTFLILILTDVPELCLD
jgi:hypothetical protein